MEVLYRHSSAIHNTMAAEAVVPIILDFAPWCKSVLDVGCGTGTWLQVFHLQYGIEDIYGIDGSYVDLSKLLIPESKFLAHDLRKPFNLNRQFDLLVCLEVAEHLPAGASDLIVNVLCGHSDLILFSAAIPGQGGQNHLNEQWPGYWEAKFLKNGYHRIDPIRPIIWSMSEVDVWYRQNLYVYTNKHELTERYSHLSVNAEVHPELWAERMHAIKRLQTEINGFEKGAAGIQRSFRAFVSALTNWIVK